MGKISERQEAIILEISNIIQALLPDAMSFHLDGDGVKVKFLENCSLDKEKNNLKIVTTNYEMKFFDRSGGKKWRA